MDLRETIYCQMRYMLTTAACVAAYGGWDPEYSKKKLIEAWNCPRENHDFITVEQLKTLTEQERFDLCFGKWEGNHWLIPLYLFPMIAKGETLISIFDEEVIVGVDYIDLDSRGGLTAFGWKD